MQVLWSRAVQTRSACRCHSCLNTAITVARRSTTTPGRRKPNFADLFTACYSAIIGTAVVADAKVKEDRRKEWDRLIAEVKRGDYHDTKDGVDQSPTIADSEVKETLSWLASLRLNACGKGTTATLRIGSTGSGSGWATRQPSNFGSITTPFKVMKSDFTRSFSSIAGPADSIYQSSYVEDSDIAEGINKKRWSLLQPREPGTDSMKLNKVEEGIARLVTQLLVTSEAQSTCSANGQDSSLQMREMVDRLAALQSDVRQVPEYNWLGGEVVRVERERLHRALLTLFQKTESGHCPINVTVAKICYNLLITTAPPSVDTYNLLVRGFTRLQQYELGERVIQSFFSESKYKPNIATAKIFLKFYSAKGDISGFRDVVRRIHSKDGIDMRVRRIPIDLLWMKKNRLWARHSDVNVTRRGDYLYMRFPRTKGVFDAIIQGILKLEGIPLTVRYVQAAMLEGKLTSSTISILVSKCVECGDVRSARLILYSLLGDLRKKRFRPGAINDFVDAQSALYDLLHLCGINTSSYNTWGDKLIHIRHRRALGHLLFHLRTRSIERAVESVSVLIQKLQSILIKAPSRRSKIRQRDLHVQTGLNDLALDVLHKHRSEHRVSLIRRNLTDDVVSRVEKLVLYRCAVIGTIQKRVFRIYYQRLPLLLQRKYRWMRTCKHLTDAQKLNWIYQFTRSRVLQKLTAEIFRLEAIVAGMQNAVASIFWRKFPPYLQEKFDSVLLKQAYLPRERLDNVCRLYRTHQKHILFKEVLKLESTVATMQDATSSSHHQTLSRQNQVTFDTLPDGDTDRPSKRLHTIFDHQQSGLGELVIRPLLLTNFIHHFTHHLRQSHHFIKRMGEEVFLIYFEKLPPELQLKFTPLRLDLIGRAESIAKIARLHREMVLDNLTKTDQQQLFAKDTVQLYESDRCFPIPTKAHKSLNGEMLYMEAQPSAPPLPLPAPIMPQRRFEASAPPTRFLERSAVTVSAG